MVTRSAHNAVTSRVKQPVGVRARNRNPRLSSSEDRGSASHLRLDVLQCTYPPAFEGPPAAAFKLHDLVLLSAGNLSPDAGAICQDRNDAGVVELANE